MPITIFEITKYIYSYSIPNQSERKVWKMIEELLELKQITQNVDQRQTIWTVFDPELHEHSSTLRQIELHCQFN